MNGIEIFTELFSDTQALPRFTVVLLTKGKVEIMKNSGKITLPAPALICRNETEDLNFRFEDQSTFSGVSFIPELINSELTFSTVREDSPLSRSAVLDKYFLFPFTIRSASFNGIISPGPRTALALTDKFKKLFADFAANDKPFWPCRTRSSLIELLTVIVSACNPDEGVEELSTVTQDDLVTDVVQYLTENYHDTITLPRLCAFFNTNRNTLSQRFKTATGHTVIEELQKIRTRIASALLRETSLPAEEIGYRAGFNDTAHFTRTFKKHYNATPAAYRRQFR